jgi:putative transposase
MPTGLHRSYGSHDMHFITCSCFGRRPLLGDPELRTLLLKMIEDARQSFQFVVAAFVVMPEHFHLLVSEPERADLSQVMQVLKQRVARRALSGLRRSGSNRPNEEHFWQRRFYDFNVWSAAKNAEKVHYIHQNPVRRGLVANPDQWFWSSFRAYACQEPGIVAVNAAGSARLRLRSPVA